MKSLVVVSMLLFAARSGAQVDALDLERMRGDERALLADPFAEAPLRDLVQVARRSHGEAALWKRYAARPDAVGLIVAGRLYEASGKRALAVESLRKAGALPSLPPRSQARLGLLLESLGARPEAIAAYDRALASGGLPDADTLAFHVGVLFLDAHNPKEAQKRFEKVHASAPRDVELRRKVAESLAAHGAFKEAQAELEGALALTREPALKVTLLRRAGEWHKRAGEWRPAAAAYLEAWQLLEPEAPQRGELLEQIVGLYRSHGALEELIAKVSRSDRAWDHVLAGEAQLQRGKKDRAAEEYKKALAKDPQLVLARQRLATVVVTTPEERAQLAAELVESNADNPAYRLDLGRALFSAKRDGEAVAALKRAAVRFADAPYVQAEIADLLAANGRCDEAAPLYDRAVALEARNPEYEQARGDCYVKLGDRKKALGAFRDILGSGATVDSYLRVIDLLRTRGFTDEVTALYEEALAHYASDEELRRNYAGWLTARNDLPRAIKEWKYLSEKASQSSLRDMARYQLSELERKQLLNQ